MTRALRALLATVLGLGLVTAAAPPAHAESYVPISGAGSTWSLVAVEAWATDVRASGIVVNFAGSGSTDGRSRFIQATADFINTEIPFQNPPEPGQQAEDPSRAYAYLPIVAGGTSFMYNLTLGGERIRDLKLSAPTLAKIFTGEITRWSDPAIARDYGRALPDIPVVPILRADGAGASAQMTLYLRNQVPGTYCPFIRSKLRLGGDACPSVSFYPAFGKSKAFVGSNGVANYVAASYGEGAIGYVEYAYAKNLGFPVASLLNKAGYFAQPSASNVAVALTRAVIEDDERSPLYLTQKLESVYNNPDPRTYPMSSYSYMVVPTSTQEPFTSAKGKTLSTFIDYFLCTGQQKADILGYSPLPRNLVQAGFDQVRRIPGHIEPSSISECNNPALRILQTAPQPDPCDKAGALCGGGSGGTGAGSTGGSGAGGASGAAAGAGSGGSAGTGSGTTAGSGSGGRAVAGTDGTGVALPGAAGSAGTSIGAGAGTVLDPTLAGVSADATPQTGTTTALPADRQGGSNDTLLYAVSVACLVGAVLAPPLLVRFRRRTG